MRGNDPLTFLDLGHCLQINNNKSEGTSERLHLLQRSVSDTARLLYRLLLVEGSNNGTNNDSNVFSPHIWNIPSYVQSTKIAFSPSCSGRGLKKRGTHGGGMVGMIYRDAEAAPALEPHGSHSFSISIFMLAFQECRCPDTLTNLRQFSDTQEAHLRWHGTERAVASLGRYSIWLNSTFSF